ncbi:hypothetical protein HQ496_09915 [bacterium]|nr:hypothetical protein [bacterium]
MSLIHYSIFEYSIPFIRPIRIGSQLQSHRKGLYVKATNERGTVGWGEMAPLDGYGPDTLHGVKTALFSDDGHYSESIRFGLDCAKREIRAQESGISFRDTFGPQRRPAIASAQLVSSPAGFDVRFLKTKVGAAPIQEDASRVASLLAALPTGGLLRLDANGLWTKDEAFSFAESLGALDSRAKDRIEFIEEPWNGCFEGSEINYLSDFPFPLAIDERFSMENDAWLLADVVVIKPCMFGSIDEFLLAKQHISSKGKGIVISSAFESFLGMSALVALASAHGQGAEGFGTYSYLDRSKLELDLTLAGHSTDWLLAAEIECAHIPAIPGRWVNESALTILGSFTKADRS